MMKKITDFIVNKRKFILVFFIMLAIGCGYLSSKVNVNSDLTKYLPKTSETRIGLDIMEDNFADTSNLSVMFKDLSEDDKIRIKNELENIEYVDSVSYDNSDNYNKDNYTLYELKVSYASNSKEAAKVYSDVNEKYENAYTSGSIASENAEVMPIWIVVLAVFCALIILIIMCESYTEPFLILFVILLAVVLNMGSNVMFKSVSNITSSIAAILQMALSMDYSIMLINRYNQEKGKEKNRIKAMKNALYNAFLSISSSSVTTIVGLLTLVFMTFTIGRDLGFVLAKGVLLSLVCIFTCLPGLILMFDKLIDKTRKKSFTINLTLLGKFSNKIRYVGLIIFILVFAGSYLLKGNLNYEFINNDSDKIKEVFPENNELALIYKNENEEKVASFLKNIEDYDHVNNVLAYGNTINEKLKYKELNQKLKDLGTDAEISDYLLKIIYYDYYNKNDSSKMTFDEFISFIKTKVYNNKDVKVDNNLKNNLNTLENFTSVNNINKKRTVDELSSIFGIDKSNVTDLMIYYNSKNVSSKMTLNEFVNFMNKDVLNNPKYNKNIDNTLSNNLKTMAKFTNKNTINEKMNYEKIAFLFGIDKNIVKDLFTYYSSLNPSIKLSLFDLSEFMLKEEVINKTLDQNTKDSIKLLNTLSNKNVIDTVKSSKEISLMFNIDEDLVKQIIMLDYNSNTKMTLNEFTHTVLYLKENTDYLKNMDTSKILEISKNEQLMSDTTKYSKEEISKLVGSSVSLIYTLKDFQNKDVSISPYEFINALTSNNAVMAKIDSNDKIKIELAKNIMDSCQNNLTYNYEEAAKVIGIDSSLLKKIYGLYNSNNVLITPKEFTNFILEHYNDELLKGKISNNSLDSLKLAKQIITSTNNNIKYSVKELSSFLGINENNLKLLYSLYESSYKKNNSKISLKDFTYFILEDVLKQEEYAQSFTDKDKDKLQVLDGIINSTINNTQYKSSELCAILNRLNEDIDSNLIDLVYTYYGSINLYNDDYTLTVLEFVNYLNDKILPDKRFNDFIDKQMREDIKKAHDSVNDAKKLLVSSNYSRVVIDTDFDLEGDEVYNFITYIHDNLQNNLSESYLASNSTMAYEMNNTFSGELDYITIITMISIFVVVAITFKSILLPIILVLTIQCAVYLTMASLSFTGGSVYFISILIVQSILMGATIDYAIVFTSYYLESRKKNKNVKESLINAYNSSINTILTSASILIIVTLIIGLLTEGVTSKICNTLSLGTFCAEILILFILPPVIAATDKIILRHNK